MAEHEFEEKLSPNLYFDRDHNCEAVKIMPGEYFATMRDMLLVTTLGSCVCACIRDKVSGIGGINHFMLPNSGSDIKNMTGQSARYGTYAMEVLINQLIKMGAKRSNFEAKLFGGASVLRGFTVNNIGDSNAEFALNYLKTEKIPIAAQDLLDIYPRKVYFFPSTGRVRVKKLRNIHNDTLMNREAEYNKLLNQSSMAGDVELFR